MTSHFLWIELTNILSLEILSRSVYQWTGKEEANYGGLERMLRWPFEGQEMSNQIVFVTRLILCDDHQKFERMAV